LGQREGRRECAQIFGLQEKNVGGLVKEHDPGWYFSALSINQNNTAAFRNNV